MREARRDIAASRVLRWVPGLVPLASLASLARDTRARKSPSREVRPRVPVAQMRWKTSLPRVLVRRPFRPTMVAVNLVATVLGPTKRPDQTAFTLQSEVHVREV